MCIVLITTAHPKYALIALDNRDEYILRPTSRPHWWTHQPSGEEILSSRDLYRKERGTWLGVTKSGRFAVLTNYRESSEDDPDPDHAIAGVRSRGTIVNAWLGAPSGLGLEDFVSTMLEDRATKGVGGFSLVCGDLKQRTEKGIKPLAIISNRWDHVGEVPWIGGERAQTYGLSNAVYVEPAQWEKIKIGKELTKEAIQEAIEKDMDEETLTERLFAVLDHDTLPLEPNMSFQEYMNALRKSVFIRSFAGDQGWKEMADAANEGRAKAAFDEIEDISESEEHKDAHSYFMKGAYGTQRQTILLLDWEGNITYKERALYDSHGNPIERGKGDETFKFKIEE
ncbi:DUF833-domain-containing protein [Daldinia caldariorum]|uniref:DUF833-domain-containing protein n=1 Tax=Daldinia caldariorum TaxID=326644 RepID=UPI0020085FE1|nr:DUF833-domain-containing protein [Daldinia caldariorum]KAI1472987.1 DUF833-domain-containing protein [Daldinia caldariorum]